MNRNARQRTRFNLRVFGGSSHPDLTKSVARKVGVRIGEVTLKKFANNETSVVLNENVRGKVRKNIKNIRAISQVFYSFRMFMSFKQEVGPIQMMI